MTQKGKCPACGDSGRILKTTQKACPRCTGGRGPTGRQCYTCLGSGYIIKQEWLKCTQCKVGARKGCLFIGVMCGIAVGVIIWILR